MRFDFWTLCGGCNEVVSKEPWESPLQLCDECYAKEQSRCECGGEGEELSRDGFKCKKCGAVYFIENFLQFGEKPAVYYHELFGDDEWKPYAEQKESTSILKSAELEECAPTAV